MNENGSWKVSPAYDLTFSSGPAGEHCTTVMREGKNPGLSHLLKLADVAGINKPNALKIVSEVADATFKWKIFAKQANVTPKSYDRIQMALEHVKKNF